MKRAFNTKSIIPAIFIIILVVTFSGCSKNNVTSAINDKVKETKEVNFANIVPEEAKKRLDSEKDIILLDVRTLEEYEAGHLKESMLIPLDNLEKEAEGKLTDKNVDIFISCRSGNRSVTAANILLIKDIQSYIVRACPLLLFVKHLYCEYSELKFRLI